MDPITMMLASVGMQFFNNYATSNKNREIQAKQREFQRAAAEHDFERARKAQAEAARIALELEAEVHQERVEDIQKNYDSLLENFAQGLAISNWPLNVLPFVMKGESFGSLIGGTAKSISMHCVFTPSNCAWFNECFYDEIDSRVEAEMNNNWNSQSTHPIVYYGGGWNRRDGKHGSIPSLIDLNDIALLKINLKNIPTMVITPYFDPYLHFKVQLWGMGKDSDMPFRIDIPNNETVVHNRIFTFDYNKDSTPEFSENFYYTTTKEFVAYVVSLIGFLADKYFWSMYYVKPMLPNLLVNKYDFCINNYANLYFDATKEEFDVNHYSTLEEFKNKVEYVESVKPILSKEQSEELKTTLFRQLYDFYCPDLIPGQSTTFEEAIISFENVLSRKNSVIWVELNEFNEALYKREKVDRLDLVSKLTHFIEFVNDNNNLLPEHTSIYIGEENFLTFTFHVFNSESSKILQMDNGFDYLVESSKLPFHYKNIKTIFGNKKKNNIICKYDKIINLINKIEDISLVF